MTKDIVKKRIPIRNWDELDRRNAIIARMVADRPSIAKLNEQEQNRRDTSH